jgi:flagellar hook-length control protein FliK
MNMFLKTSAQGTETNYRTPSSPLPDIGGIRPADVTSSAFSRLLDRQLSGSGNEAAKPVQDDLKDRTNEADPNRNQDHHIEDSSRKVGEESSASSTSAQKSTTDSTAHATGEGTSPEFSGLPTDSLTALVGALPLPGFAHSVLSPLVAVSGTEGIPVEIRSQLAGDIAARFSDTNGTQTLTMKLEPGNLGQVEARLEARGNHLTVRFAAADRETEAALKGSVKDLSEAIQEKTGRFQTVEVRVDLKMANDQGKEPGTDARQSNKGEQEGKPRQEPESGDANDENAAGGDSHSTPDFEKQEG